MATAPSDTETTSDTDTETEQTARTDADSPYRRDNWWYDDTDESIPEAETPADQPLGTTSAKAIMFQELIGLVDPVCGRTLDENGEEIELTDPEFYLPKQRERTEGYDEFTQHSTPRRINPETGFINGGESTSTAIGEVDKETYLQAVENFLARTGYLTANLEDWRQHAHRLWHDPQYNSTKALTIFIRHKREYDQNRRTSVP